MDKCNDCRPRVCVSRVIYGEKGATTTQDFTALVTDHGEGALALVEGTDAAESELTEAAFNEEHRFTIEHSVAAVLTVIKREAVFENEADRQTISEVFRALQAPAGAGLLAGFHGEGVNVVTLAVHINVVVLQTGINNTVKRHISSDGGAGKSAENSNCS